MICYVQSVIYNSKLLVISQTPNKRNLITTVMASYIMGYTGVIKSTSILLTEKTDCLWQQIGIKNLLKFHFWVYAQKN